MDDRQKELNKKKEQLLEPFIPDMRVKSKKWTIPYLETEDIFQELYLKCWSALDKHRGTSTLRTYLWRVMDNHLKDMLRHASINRPDDYSTEEEDEAIENIIDAKILKEDVVRDIERLPDREKEIIKLRFGLADGISYTLEEIGDMFNLSKTRIKQIEEEAISKIKSLKDIKK